MGSAAPPMGSEPPVRWPPLGRRSRVGMAAASPPRERRVLNAGARTATLGARRARKGRQAAAAGRQRGHRRRGAGMVSGSIPGRSRVDAGWILGVDTCLKASDSPGSASSFAKATSTGARHRVSLDSDWVGPGPICVVDAKPIRADLGLEHAPPPPDSPREALRLGAARRHVRRALRFEAHGEVLREGARHVRHHGGKAVVHRAAHRGGGRGGDGGDEAAPRRLGACGRG